MFELLILGLIIWGIYYWYKETRLERQKNKFENYRVNFVSNEASKREKKANEVQKANMKELASIVEPILEKFQREIPPRLFDEIKKEISLYIENLEFQKLYDLYNVLLSSNTKNIYHNIDNLRR